MRKNFKLLSLILTICVALSLSACTIVQNLPNQSLGGEGGAQTYDVVVNTVQSEGQNYSSLTEMLDAVRPSVVEVYGQSDIMQGTASGSGIVVSKVTENDKDYYYVLTCSHVLDYTDIYLIRDIDGNAYSAALIGADPISDIAVLKITPKTEKSNLAIATLRLEKDAVKPLKVGEEVVAIGNPLGVLGGTVTSGIVSTVSREVKVEGLVMNLIQTDCAINGGNSGGGLFDYQGNLIGVVNAGYTGAQGLNFAIPIDDAYSVFEKLMDTYFYKSAFNYNYGYVEGRAMIRIEMAYNLPFGYDMVVEDYGTSFKNYKCCIMGVSAASDYYKAGLRAGDCIKAVSFKNETINVDSAYDFMDFISGKQVVIGDQMTFTVVNMTTGAQSTKVVTFSQFILGNTGKTK